MAQPRRVNREKYARAQEYIRSGGWTVDLGTGQIRSSRTGQPLRLRTTRHGYHDARVYFPGGGRANVLVSRVVWESVNGPIPDGLEVNHKDGVKTSNRITNLELTTPAQNKRHAHDMGLCGWDVPAETIGQVEAALAKGEGSYSQLAKRFGVSHGTVAKVNAARPDYVKPVPADPNRAEKPCCKCGEVKPIDEYPRNRAKPDGRTSACRPCKNAEARRNDQARKRNAAA